MAAIALVVALFAAACGTDSTTVESSSAANADQTEASSSDDAAAGADGADEEEAAPAADSDSSSDPEPAAEGPVAVADHEFPDLGTVNIVDGSAVNLADQLAGGDTPVLLWFFAPH
ncbi:MAG: hypothetical protein ACRBK7_26025 [Acidimicrobiales bacterium]